MRLDDLTFAELRDLTDATVLVAASSEAGLFSTLREAPGSAEEVAERLGGDLRATRIVLEALVETGLLERSGEGEGEGERYAPTARCAAELCDPDASSYVGHGMPHWLRGVRSATGLAEALRRGGPLQPRRAVRSPEHVARFTAAMRAMPEVRRERIVDLCLERLPGAASVLDVGGGAGHLTRAFVQRGLVGTLFDTADVIGHVVGAYDLTDIPGLEVVAGDFTRDALPPGPFDLVLLSNILHIHGASANAELFEKVTAVSARGGVVAAVGFFRGLSPRASNLGVRMLLKSERGDACSERAVRDWMERAGFADVRVDALDGDRHVLTAFRM